TGLRGFLITGDETYLQPYQPGREAFVIAIGRAQVYTAGHPGQLALLRKIRGLENAWRTRFVEPLIAKRRALSAAGARANEAFEVVRLGTGKAFVDEMRALLTEVQRIELERSARASAGLESYFRTSTTMIMAGSAVVLLLVIVLAATLARNLRKMAQVNHLLEMEVAERKTAEAHTQTMRDRLDLALDGAGLALWDYDVRSGDVYLGPHWNEMLGGERVEVTTGVATLQKMMHPDDAGQVSKLMRDIVRGSSDGYRAE